MGMNWRGLSLCPTNDRPMTVFIFAIWVGDASDAEITHFPFKFKKKKKTLKWQSKSSLVLGKFCMHFCYVIPAFLNIYKWCISQLKQKKKKKQAKQTLWLQLPSFNAVCCQRLLVMMSLNNSDYKCWQKQFCPFPVDCRQAEYDKSGHKNLQ